MSDRLQARMRGEQAALSYGELRAILYHRYGWVLSKARIQQICCAAERKIRRALEGKR